MRLLCLFISIFSAALMMTACGKPGKKSSSPEEQIISYRTRATDGSCELPTKHFKGLNAFCKFLINDELNENCAQEKRHNQFRAKCVVDGKPVIEDVPEAILNGETTNPERPATPDTTPGGDKDQPDGDPEAGDPNKETPPAPADTVVETPTDKGLEKISLELLANFKESGDNIIAINADRRRDENKIIEVTIPVKLFTPRTRIELNTLELAVSDPDLLKIETAGGLETNECNLSLDGTLQLTSGGNTDSMITLKGLDPIKPNQSEAQGPCEVFANMMKAAIIGGDSLTIMILNMPHPEDDKKVFSEIELKIEAKPEVGVEATNGLAPEAGVDLTEVPDQSPEE